MSATPEHRYSKEVVLAVTKLDFFTEGLIKNYLKDGQGIYHDWQIMIKQLHKGWDDF